MKTRFDTYDLVCSIAELQRLIGMRVNQIYDVDHRTYLIRLQRGEEKCVLLLESGNRIHTTAFEWPKNTAPSGFSMKMRKHLKNKRLESLTQIGSDRIVDLQFGSNEAAYHVILEVYDRGNIILTDYKLITLNILRPHTEGDKLRFAVKEKYPVDRARSTTMSPRNVIEERLTLSKAGESLKKILNPLVEFGSALIEHVLMKSEFQSGAKIGKGFKIEKDMDRLWSALELADTILANAKVAASKGYIIQKREIKPSQDDKTGEFILANIDFHPELLEQYKNQPFREFDTFDLAVDEYFSTMEGQKLDLKALAQEKDALKKLENVRKDHDQRLVKLGIVQEEDKLKAELITRNQVLVDNAILAVQSALANQISWPEIEVLIKEAQIRRDSVACAIKKLKLETNHITMYLSNPYAAIDHDNDDNDGTNDDDNSDADIDDNNDDDHDNSLHVDESISRNAESNAKNQKKPQKPSKNKKISKKKVGKHGKVDDNDDELNPMLIDIDLALSAFANATKYYDMKRSAAKKHQKTIESHGKALKSAEKKTKQTLKEVQAIHSINKARKVYWFEKFFWFISSENYLVIGGRDQQQNEMIVKRYLRPGDLYVHADLTGASSVVIKNPTGAPVPPKTLGEAGTMAVAYSIAWDAKVVAGAYWVHHDQVSKKAPTGEYLTTGSFMIRGKKNYLPPCQLVMGLGFLFRLEDSSIERHQGERRIRTLDDDESTVESEDVGDDKEIIVEGSDDSDDDQHEKGKNCERLASINEDDAEGDCFNNVEIDVQKDDDSSSDSDDTDGTSHFPDTRININISGDQVKLEMQNNRPLALDQHDDEHVIYLGDDKPVVLQPKIAKKSNQKVSGPVVQFQQPCQQSETKQESGRSKRRQKAKQKKIKEKYKDQDEEDRQIVMEMLKPNPVREARKIKKSKKVGQKLTQAQRKTMNMLNHQQNQKPLVNPENAENVDDDDDEDPGPGPEIDMLDQLTGKPIEEDELLFAVPVVAPYNAALNYKFKVKLTPGNARRGKAAKTALAAFLKDKTITQREKDLLKAVKDENVARNIPGKVKISAPSIQKVKK